MTPERFCEIEPIAAELMNLAPQELERRLADLPASLRQDVETLLTADIEAEASGDLSDLTEYVRKSALPENLGPWKISGLIGRGGMGVVYHGVRDNAGFEEHVAIKVLRSSETSLSFRIRFDQERRILSSLNHPNIARMLDGGEGPMGPYIVLEYLEGGDIISFCDSRQLSPESRLRLFLDVCGAVQYAHSRGLLHRDLKPANVLMTKDGTPKLLDFGIAKSMEGFQAQTTTGSLALTPQYATPEQIQGGISTAASDVYSLGALLYELLTGTPAQHITSHNPLEWARVICEQPVRPASSLVSGFHRDLDVILQKALRKDPGRRYASVELFASDIARYLEGKRVLARPDGFPYRIGKFFRRHAAAFVAAMRILALATSVAIYFHPRQPPAIQSDVLPLTGLDGNEVSPSFSPDGKQIAFSWDGNGGRFNVYTKPLNSPRVTIVTHGLGDNMNPVWSPDGRQIAFLRVNGSEIDLMITPFGGSERRIEGIHPPEAQVLRDFWRSRFCGPAWSPNGAELAVVDSCPSGETECIYLVSAANGNKRLLTLPGRYMLGDRSPAFSPNGVFLAYSRSKTMAVSDLYVQRVTGGAPIRITHDECNLGGITWTHDGREIIFSSTRSGTQRLWRIRAFGGTPYLIDVGSRNVFQPAVSAAGNHLAYVEDIENRDIWQMPIPFRKNSRIMRLISSSRRNDSPRYSRDGRKIAFASDRSGAWEIWAADANGTNLKQVTHFGKGLTGSPRWSPDGRYIVFDSRQGNYAAIFTIQADGGSPQQITGSTSNNMLPEWSTDGQWIYFNSDRSGKHEIWKRSMVDGKLVQITRNGAYEPYESSDGRYIYFWKYYGEGVWRISSDGGIEEPVAGLESYRHTRYFDVARRGIYFVADRSEPSEIRFFSFQTRLISPVGEIGRHLVAGTPGLTVSPDEKRIVFAEFDHYSTDILMVEKFR